MRVLGAYRKIWWFKGLKRGWEANFEFMNSWACTEQTATLVVSQGPGASGSQATIMSWKGSGCQVRLLWTAGRTLGPTASDAVGRTAAH